MSSLDMSEAVRMLANEKNISVDTLLHVLVDALATAYKRRPGAAAEVVVEVNPDTLEFTFTAWNSSPPQVVAPPSGLAAVHSPVVPQVEPGLQPAVRQSLTHRPSWSDVHVQLQSGRSTVCTAVTRA